MLSCKACRMCGQEIKRDLTEDDDPILLCEGCLLLLKQSGSIKLYRKRYGSQMDNTYGYEYREWID